MLHKYAAHHMFRQQGLTLGDKNTFKDLLNVSFLSQPTIVTPISTPLIPFARVEEEVNQIEGLVKESNDSTSSLSSTGNGKVDGCSIAIPFSRASHEPLQNTSVLVNVSNILFRNLPSTTREITLECDCYNISHGEFRDRSGNRECGCCDWSHFLKNNSFFSSNQQPVQDFKGCISRVDFQRLISAIPISLSQNYSSLQSSSVIDRVYGEIKGDGDDDEIPLFLNVPDKGKSSILSLPSSISSFVTPFITTIHLAPCPGLVVDDSLVTYIAVRLGDTLRSLLLQVFFYLFFFLLMIFFYIAILSCL
jgi:hypothetical protein